MLKVQALQSIRHGVALLAQIFHRDDLPVLVVTRKQAARIWQVVVGELLQHRHQVSVGSDFVLEGGIASKKLSPRLVHDVPLDDETRFVF